MSRPGLQAVLFALVVASAAPAFAQEKTPTPGDVALLLVHHDANSVAALRAALTQNDPAVRVVAARVAAVAPHPELLADLTGALTREQDEHVASELVRDVLLLGGSATLDAVTAEARRRGAGAALALAEWLARAQPQRFIDTLPDLTTMAGHFSGSLPDIVAMSSWQHPDLRDKVFGAWIKAATGRTWRDLLDQTFGAPADLLPIETVLKQALASDRQEVREQTVWFIVDAFAEKRAVPDGVAAAAMPRPGQPADWEAFGRELIARHRTHATTPDRSDLIRSEALNHEDEAWQARTFPELTDSERTAVERAFAGRASSSDPGWSGPSRARTVPFIAPGVIASTLQAARCAPSSNVFATAVLTYGDDGRPKNSRVDPAGLTPPCAEAASALGRLSLPDDDYPVTQASQLVVVPITPAFAACTSEPALWRSDTGISKISPLVGRPRKVHDVRPEYPQAALDQGVQGTVVLRVLLAPSGCPFSISVLRSLQYLDLPSLRAVSQWAWDPLRLEGEPKPILMTITLEFTVR